MSLLDGYVDRAAARVQEYGEDPRMAVSVVVDDALAADQREVVLERVQEQVTVPVADGGSSALDTDIEDIGVADGESWAEAAERLRDDERCPACGAEGDLKETLAPGQRRCSTPIERCAVLTFMEGPRDD
ncbi:hypothetical protein [Haloarcula sp. CGMCC 1.6347]|uniref:hypothetical protein n=1 Tax=Haloarcula sp. CGMCC 1.6347 TaxID=3111455 RepID=UPI00300F0C64